MFPKVGRSKRKQLKILVFVSEWSRKGERDGSKGTKTHQKIKKRREHSKTAKPEPSKNKELSWRMLSPGKMQRQRVTNSRQHLRSRNAKRFNL